MGRLLAIVEPVDPVQRSEFDGFDARPGAFSTHQLRLEEGGVPYADYKWLGQ